MRDLSLVAVLDRLTTSNCNFAVLRGAEEWPHFPSDLDLLVSAEDQAKAIAAALQVLSTFAWDVIVVCRHVDIPVIWAGKQSPAELLEIDVAAQVTWAGAPFLNVDRALSHLQERLPFPVLRPGDQALVLGLPALLGSKRVLYAKGRARLPELRRCVEKDFEGALAAWSEVLGASAAHDVLQAIKVEDLQALANIRRALRQRAIRQRVVHQPRDLVARYAFIATRRLRVHQCGLWHARGRALSPLREPDADPDDWLRRLQLIANGHTTAATGVGR